MKTVFYLEETADKCVAFLLTSLISRRLKVETLQETCAAISAQKSKSPSLKCPMHKSNEILNMESFLGGFHLDLLVFPFVYQFSSRIEVLVNSSFEND